MGESLIYPRLNNRLERKMDITTISCGSATRDRLAEYRDEHGHPNYDDAISSLLEEVSE